MPPYEQLTMIPCTDPHCPSRKEHNIGAYNFALFLREENRTNKLPSDIRNLLVSIRFGLGPKWANHDLEDLLLLAKFAVVHQSHRKGLMPAEIADRATWKHPKIVDILREGVGRQPLNANDKVWYGQSKV